MPRTKLLLVVVCASALAVVGCRPSSEIRPAFTKEMKAEAGVLDGRIIFTSQAAEENALFEVTPGSAPSDLDLTPAPERSPALSPDGTRLAFAVTGDRTGIWTASADGGAAEPVVMTEGLFDHPVFSPDGTRIAYTHSPGPQSSWDVYVVGIDGSGAERLTEDPAQDWYPTWSPDGGRIAFTSDRDGDNAIWVLDVATKQARKLVDSNEQDEQPAWSPDGRHILYSSNRDLNRWQLFVHDVAGGDDRNLLRTDAMDRFPSWSPDGRYILVSVGYLGVYRTDGEKFPNGADRWKLSDRLALTSAWGR